MFGELSLAVQDPSLDGIADINQNYYDWVHNWVANGVANRQIGLTVAALKQYGIGYEDKRA